MPIICFKLRPDFFNPTADVRRRGRIIFQMKTNLIKINLAILGVVFLSMLKAPALDEQCNSCERPVLINGDY